MRIKNIMYFFSDKDDWFSKSHNPKVIIRTMIYYVNISLQKNNDLFSNTINLMKDRTSYKAGELDSTKTPHPTNNE